MAASLTSSNFLSMPTLSATSEGKSGEKPSESPLHQELYTALTRFVELFQNEISFSTVPSSDKLGKLSLTLLVDLASDMRDEINRRNANFPSSLSPCEDFTERRNNSRKKLSTFTNKKIAEYCADVAFELERRNLVNGTYFAVRKDPSKAEATKSPPQPQSSEGRKLEVSPVSPLKRIRSENPLPPLPVPSTSQPTALTAGMATAANASMTSVETSFTSTTPTTATTVTAASNKALSLAPFIGGMDSLFSMIDDISCLVSEEDCAGSNEEVDAIKQKHALEIAGLNNTISKYENDILPGKNREIVKLMSRVEEAEVQIQRLLGEVAKLKEELNNRDRIIADQRSANAILMAALERIQHEIAERANLDTNRAKQSLIAELKASPVFHELNAINQLISKAIVSIEEAFSSQNKKAFLKLLRDVANAAKSSLIGFERLLQCFNDLHIEDIVKEGNGLRNNFVQSLSELLVAGKDYGMVPNNFTTLRPALDLFKTCHESIASFQNRMESSLDTL